MRNNHPRRLLRSKLPSGLCIGRMQQGLRIAMLAGSAFGYLWFEPAEAQNPAEALQQFDLIGTWSPDCSKNPDIEPAARVIYEAFSTGVAQYASFIRAPNGTTIKTKMEIQQAEILDGPRIRIVIQPREITSSIGPETRPFFFKQQEIIIEKVGPKMHVLSNRFMDGTGTLTENGRARNGQIMPLIEKCEASS
jgi:hypothetical protein